MITDSVMSGRLLRRPMLVWLPGGMLKSISSWPGVTLAQLMASRNESGPLSLVLLTVIVERTWRSSRASTPGRKGERFKVGLLGAIRTAGAPPAGGALR